jgi:glycosyltransferase involved in cell wall biosynthesis
MSVPNVPVCLNISLHADEQYGGLAASVPRLCEAIDGTGRFSNHLAVLCEKDELTPVSLASEVVHRFPTGRLRWLKSTALRRHLEELIQDAAIVHIHGLWEEYSALTSRICRRLGKPYVVSAHGMLEPWALNHGKWKKRVYLAAIEGPVLRGAIGLRALTLAETTDYKNIGLQNPIRVIPNGIDMPEASSPRTFLEAFPHLNGRRLVLFLGRIHPKKGIDLLCRAWAHLEGSLPDSHLVIAGPDDGRTLAGLIELVSNLGVKDRVTFTGMLRGPVKWSALAASSVFVLPSHSEGFSVAVLEALACGLPALVSRNCHFPEITEEGCGWEIDPDEEQLRFVLSRALAMDPCKLAGMSERGRQLVAEHYTWKAIGRRAADMLEEWSVPADRGGMQTGGAPVPVDRDIHSQ